MGTRDLTVNKADKICPAGVYSLVGDTKTMTGNKFCEERLGKGWGRKCVHVRMSRWGRYQLSRAE